LLYNGSDKRRAIMIEYKTVEGKEKGNVTLYALSTCGWCQKTKKLLNSLGVKYRYADVDTLEEKASTEAFKLMLKWNPDGSFPTLVIDDSSCILGFKEDEIREKLG
jgi:glutaredoxin